MNNQEKYNINLNIKYDHLQLIDVPAIIAETMDVWFNQTLTKVNDSVVRIGIVHGEFHWHKHDIDDEFFFVLQGNLFVDLEDRTISLGLHQGLTVSKGILHRTRALEKTVILMIEGAEIAPTGDLDKK